MEIRKRIPVLLVVTFFLSLFGLSPNSQGKEKTRHTPTKEIGMAVEFMDHAACAYVARDKGWFVEEGLTLSAYESYVTGMALAAALARGDIQVAYVCLVPAINAYANAKVPLKIIAGTHRYGYGLVVNPRKIKLIRDLEKPGIRIGSVREGGAVDVLLHRVIDMYDLDEGMILRRVKQMNPPKQILAIKMGQLDAAFLPEQWATMAEDFGLTMLLTGKDVWPEMQGSVLAVKEELIRDDPEIARGLVKATQKATDWVNERPIEAATIMARQMSVTGEQLFPFKAAKVAARLEITPQVLLRSMARLDYTTRISPSTVQQAIDYIHHLGYIKKAFRAEDILDLRFLR
ncbi:MAG: ABC transporter substrate-binding protein [Deltaproteobacteria bacterium]|nr:MAG: ABC transporter substrate-binding protein [Deltaproteobacteria bacterium]